MIPFALVVRNEPEKLVYAVRHDQTVVVLDLNPKSPLMGRLYRSPGPGPRTSAQAAVYSASCEELLPVEAGAEVARELWKSAHPYASHRDQDLPVFLKADVPVVRANLYRDTVILGLLADKSEYYVNIKPVSKTRGLLFDSEGCYYKFRLRDALTDPGNAVAKNIVDCYIAQEAKAHQALRAIFEQDAHEQ
jgi:hypothetical protein